MHSWRRHEGNRHTEIQWAGTLTLWEPSPAQPRWAVLTGRDSGLCCFVPGWRPSGHSCHVVLLHQSTNLGEHSSPSFPPALLLAECQSKAVDQSVQQQCAQVLAALTWTVESPESPNTWAVLLGEAHLNPSTLALIVSELAEQVCYLAFQPLENFCPSVLWGPLWRGKVNLSCCHNLEDSLKLCNLTVLIMSVSSTPQLCQSTLSLPFSLKNIKKGCVPCFLTLFSNTICQQKYLVLLPKRPPSFCDYLWLVTLRGLRWPIIISRPTASSCKTLSMQTF